MALQTIARGSTTLGTPNADDDLLILGGSAKIVSNMDWSGVTQADAIEIGNEFNGDFGSDSSPFKGKVETSFFYNAGGGNAYFVSDGSASDVTPLLIMPNTAGGHLRFDTTGTITDAQIAGGQFTISTAVTVTNLYMTGGAKVRFYDDSSTDPTIIQKQGGTLYLDRGCGELTHTAGQTWIQGENANAITTLNVFGAGIHLVESGTITTLNAWGGLPCIQKLIRPLTVTTVNINMALPGAESFLQNPLLTFGTTNKYMGR